MIGQRDNASLPMRSIHDQLFGIICSQYELVMPEYAELWPEILERSSAYLCLLKYCNIAKKKKINTKEK